MEQCAQCNSQSDLRRCAGCLEVRYCSRECQKQHWKQHKASCRKTQQTSKSADSADKEPEKKTAENECAHCGSKSNLRRCARCQAVQYCTKACQICHWSQHKTVCKAGTSGDEKSQAWVVFSDGIPERRFSERARAKLASRTPDPEGPEDEISIRKAFPGLSLEEEEDASASVFCQNCGYLGKSLKRCARCKLKPIYTDRRGPIHPLENVVQRKEEAIRRVEKAAKLAEARGAHGKKKMTLTFIEAKSRARILYPGKRIVDKFRDLDNDFLRMPDYRNVVSISRMKGVHPSEFGRVARYLEDAEGKSYYMILYTAGSPEPYFRLDQVTEGNIFCIDHAHLHVFADRSVGFRVDYPWDVLIMDS